MEASSSRKRTPQGTTLQTQFQRSLSPSGRFCSSSISTQQTQILTRPISPTRVTITRPGSQTVKFSANRRTHNAAASKHRNISFLNQNKKTCACSPTTHPGSFRCSLHKGSIVRDNNQKGSAYRSSHQLNMRRSAMTNSLVRIGTVEGELVKRALAALIRPSSHSLRRRFDFQTRPSRLSVMSKAGDI